jgi:hypothetical protein
VLHQEEDEATEMQSPPLPPSLTGYVCASYLLANMRRSSKFGERMEEGVEIGDGARREVTESFPSRFSLFADASRNSRHLPPSLRPCAKDSFLHQLRMRFVCIARNGRSGCFSKTWLEDALIFGSLQQQK